jgi:nucleoside-diphosphate-sugar epimerase
VTSHRIFLTGCSGNVGGAILQELLRSGREVVALVRHDLPSHPNCRLIFGDLSKLNGTVLSEVAAADAVIHCASPRSQSRGEVLQCEIAGTAGLIDAWSAGPFIYMSSQTVYGIPRTVLLETSPLAPSCWYDIGKIVNEYQLAIAERVRRRGPGISLRLPLLFGAGPARRRGQFLPALFDALRRDHAFLCDSEEGFEMFGTVYIGEQDLARAVIEGLALREGGSFNVATGFATWRQLIGTLSRLAGIRPRYAIRPGAVPRGAEFRLPQSRSEYDCSRFETLTGFRPAEDLETILERFVSAEAG